jgi:GTP-binding protein EngB required for normal cell division
MRAEIMQSGQQASLTPGSPLLALYGVACEAGAKPVAREALALAERVSESRFYVAVLGQFKRGKSTLINALLEDSVLPTGVVPVTAVVTVVRHGPARAARICSVDGTWREIAVDDLGQYVSEVDNPGNQKGVVGVEVFAPSELLASGMCLVDTPGLGSVFTGGTEATRAFVPQMDAALLVLGADPPISEDELALLTDISQQSRNVMLVLNKADRVPARDLQEAKAFTERIVKEQIGREVSPLFEISATEAVERGVSSRDWDLLRERLGRLAREAGGQLVDAAEARGRALLTTRLLRDLDEQRDALVRPVSESEMRIEHLRQCAEDAERATQELAYLLDAEQDRLRVGFATRSEAFLGRSLANARDDFLARAGRLDKRGPFLKAAGVPIAQEVSRRWLDQWRAEEEPVAEALYAEAAQRFVALANDFLERLAKSQEAGTTELPTSVGPELGFRVKSRLFYKDLFQYVSGGPFLWIADLFRPRGRIVNRTLVPYLERLLYTNAARIENDFNERVLESRRRLEYELRARLREVYATAEQALARARAVRASGSASVQAELERLERLRRRVEALTLGAQDNSRRDEHDDH